MRKLSSLRETYIKEEPTRETPPKSDWVMQVEQFANKDKKAEIIKAWTQIEDHPVEEDMSSPVGVAYDKEDLDQEMREAYEAIGENGMVYASFEHSFWIRHKGKLIRVM